jgi:hypothetical protein
MKIDIKYICTNPKCNEEIDSVLVRFGSITGKPYCPYCEEYCELYTKFEYGIPIVHYKI